MGFAFAIAQLTMSEVCVRAEVAMSVSTGPCPVALADGAGPCLGLRCVPAGSSVQTAAVPQGQQATEMTSCHKAAACQVALPQPLAGPAQPSGPPAEAVCTDRADLQQPQPSATAEGVLCNEAAPITPGGCLPRRRAACPHTLLTLPRTTTCLFFVRCCHVPAGRARHRRPASPALVFHAALT